MKKIKLNADLYIGENKLATLKEVNNSITTGINDYMTEHPQKEYTAGNNIEISDTGVISSNIDTDTINDVVSDYLTENPPQGSDMIFNKYDSGVKTEIVNTTLKSGYVNDEGTLTTSTDTYSYAEKIPVKSGDIITVDSKGTDGVTPHHNMPMRFGCAYNDDTPVKEEGWTTAISSYTVPENINYITITVDTKNYTNHVIKKQTTDTIKVIKDELNSPLVKSKIYGSPFLSTSASNLLSGAQLVLEKNSIAKNKVLSFECNVNTINNGIIRIGHGKNSYNGNFVEINSTHASIYKYDTSKILETQEEHGLTIDGHIMVLIKVGNDNKEHITIHTKSGVFTINDKYWTGRSGYIFAEGENCDLTDVKLNWYSDDYKKSIYAYGDSYFDPVNSSRWTSYLITNGFDNFLMDSYSGRQSLTAYNSFETSLNHGTPKFALWCMGQNDPDSTDTGINTSWKEATEKFIDLCIKRGITPILSTIPNVRGGNVSDSSINTTRTHNYKNNYVKNSGYRFIDFAKAVGSYESNNWYDGMLNDADGVHPTESGAKALYMQALVDFPELMYEN